MKSLKGKKLLIMGGVKTAQNIINSAKKMGVYTIVTDYLADSPAKTIADESHMISTTDVDAVVKLAKERKVDGVFTSYIDSMLIYCRQVCERLGLPFYATEEQIAITTDKNLFKKECKKNGVGAVYKYEYNINDAYQAFDYPVIIKPVDSSGGKGISVCANAQEFMPAYQKALSFSKSGQTLIERYMTGDEVVIYYTIQDGYVSLSGMCDRYTCKEQGGVAQLPTAYIFPSKYLTIYQKADDEKVRNMLRNMHIKNGVIFLQAFMENNRCYMYESGFRFAGAQEYKIISSINGINTMDMMVRHALTGKMSGWDVRKNDNPNFNEIACKLTPLTKTGKIDKIIGLDEVAKLSGITAIAPVHDAGDFIVGKGTLDQIIARIFMKTTDLKSMKALIDNTYELVKAFDINGDDMTFGRFDTRLLSEHYYD